MIFYNHIFPDLCERYGSIEKAWDSYSGAGAYAYLKYNAEDGDEECIEFLTMLHQSFGYITDEDTLWINFNFETPVCLLNKGEVCTTIS